MKESVHGAISRVRICTIVPFSVVSVSSSSSSCSSAISLGFTILVRFLHM